VQQRGIIGSPIDHKFTEKARENPDAAIPEIVSGRGSSNKPQTQVEQGRVSWCHQNEDASGSENALDLPAGQWEIVDELQGANRNHGLEKSILIRHLSGRPTDQAGEHSVFFQNLRNVIGERMRVDTIKLIRVPRQFGKEDAATITDFQQALGMGALKHRPNQIKSKSLNPTQARPVISVAMVNRAGG